MKRMGKYTGKIYNEDTDFSKIKECCLVLNNHITEEHMNKSKKDCFFCPGDEKCLKGLN